MDIRGNQLTSIQLHGLPQLTKLDMSQNEQLATIELKDLPQLKKLSLKKCNLNEIPALHRVLSLTEIDLSENRLMVLGGDIFEGLANLKKLVLSGNNLMMLPDEISMPLKNLEVLLLSTNKIARLPSSLLRMKNLKNIELYSNQLSNVSILTKMDSLTSVNVEENGNILCSCDIVNWALNGQSKGKAFKGSCINMNLQESYEFSIEYDWKGFKSSTIPIITNETYYGCACQNNPCQNKGRCNMRCLF